MSASAPTSVTITVDGREVEVPAGTGLVEAAAAASVEIPIFCYEPRLGAPVGACRMCLVEIEGVPKLQAACATAVRPGMVVSTVSDRARQAQESVLEFLLINHPLDCPVCDKGGECPLQDHAFRWGPGTSRFGEQKRGNDKPIPISPLIALDRERCILCYRCTRFSSDVAEDNQLVTRQRGSSSVIATFEGRPYEGHFSGNVIELCPVGALTSTEYRFAGRPWENTDHPSISIADPVGPNTWSTVREGRVIRTLARENPEVDGGWLDDRSRFASAALDAPGRLVQPEQRLHRDRAIGNRPMSTPSMEVALEWLHERLDAPRSWTPDPDLPDPEGSDEEEQLPPPTELWVLSGNETLEVAWTITKLAQATGGRVVAVPGGSGAAPQHAARIADVEAARHVLVAVDGDLVDLSPQLDLRVRAAMRAGASVTVAGPGGSRLEQAGAQHMPALPGALDAAVNELCTRAEIAMAGAAPTEPGVIITRDGELAAPTLEHVAKAFGFPRDGSGVVSIPDSANARGLAALGIEAVSVDELLSHPGGLVLVGVDPGRLASEHEWGPALKRCAWTVVIDTLPSRAQLAADLTIPGAFAAEQDGTLVNLEGRLQRMTVGAEAPSARGAAGSRQPLVWLAGLARRLGMQDCAGTAATAFRRLTADPALAGRLPAATHGDIPTSGVLGVSGGPAPIARAPRAPELEPGQTALHVAPFLYDAADVRHSPRMRFLHDTAHLVLHRDEAMRLGLVRGGAATVVTSFGTFTAKVVLSRRMAAGVARVHAGSGDVPPGRTGWTAATIAPAARSTATQVDGTPGTVSAPAAAVTGGDT